MFRLFFSNFAVVTKNVLLDNDTLAFIAKHRTDDVERLALQGSSLPMANMMVALDQIEGWQTARRKLPLWVAIEELVYPPRIAMEQCSSQQTALYKLSVVERLCPTADEGRTSMVDLTGGFGVDFSFLARYFSEATYIERHARLCEIAEHNFNRLGLTRAKVICADSKEVFPTMKPLDFAYCDPSRRNANGDRTYAIEDCSPNVKDLNRLLLEKSSVAMIKLSPMLDWRRAVDELEGAEEVHIVSVDNECKELLLVLCGKNVENRSLRLFCANNNQIEIFSPDKEKSLSPLFAPPLTPDIGGFLFEPNASIMKGGCFASLSQMYGVKMLSHNSHLFVSPDETPDFPGRRFRIMAVTKMNKRDLKTHLAGISKANIAVRNFPLTAKELRKRLLLSDGGDIYIFGTTDSARQHWLLICQKL